MILRSVNNDFDKRLVIIDPKMTRTKLKELKKTNRQLNKDSKNVREDQIIKS